MKNSFCNYWKHVRKALFLIYQKKLSERSFLLSQRGESPLPQDSEWIANRSEWIANYSEWIANRSEWIANRSEWIANRSEWIANHSEWIANHSEWIANHSEWVANRSEWIATRANTGVRPYNSSEPGFAGFTGWETDKSNAGFFAVGCGS